MQPNWIRYFFAAAYLPIDLMGHLRHEGHVSRSSTLAALRLIYVVSRGWSRQAFLAAFRILRPLSMRTLQAPYNDCIAKLRSDGIATIHCFLRPDEVRDIRDFLFIQLGTPVGRSNIAVTVAEMRSGVRLDYSSETVLAAPHVKRLVASRRLQEIAAAYLQCKPVFTNVCAWWSLPDPNATANVLDRAAQMYHFDYDWPAFVKFLIYLTDVEIDNGPFIFVKGTHEHKSEWRDGRFSDEYIERIYRDAVKSVTGKAGDLIVADTSAYHKGGRVRGGARLMLQLEYAVSRLGSSCQYDTLPAHLRPKGIGPHTFDVFCR